MKKTTAVYSGLISLAGIIIGAIYTYLYFNSWANAASIWDELNYFIPLFLICTLCRSLPLYISENSSVDMSFISIFAIVLLQGPYAAVAIVFLSTPFVVVPSMDPQKKYSHCFNTPPIKTLFNMGNYILAIALGSACFQLIGGVFGSLALPDIILPALLFVLVAILANCGLLVLLFYIDGQEKFLPLLCGTIVSLLPSICMSAPIGYFIAYLGSSSKNAYISLLFLLPLMLARYAFKLYLDSKKQYYNMIKTLSAAIEAKDQYTEGHSRRVEQYAVQIAKQMRLSGRRTETIRVAALLHDIGKIGVDDNVLNKAGALDNTEWDMIKRHPDIGFHILEEVTLPQNTKEIIVCHHERYDGQGYPSHKNADEIPMEAFILGVADSFDAMTSDRPYRKGMSVDKALSIIKEESGKQFHPKTAQAFLSSMLTSQ